MKWMWSSLAEHNHLSAFIYIQQPGGTDVCLCSIWDTYVDCGWAALMAQKKLQHNFICVFFSITVKHYKFYDFIGLFELTYLCLRFIIGIVIDWYFRFIWCIIRRSRCIRFHMYIYGTHIQSLSIKEVQVKYSLF